MHTQLRAPLTVVWDNCITTSARLMRCFAERTDWLVQLPEYAPELNPTEGVWSHAKRDPGNLAASGLDQLAATVKTLLKATQYHPDLINSFIAETGLTIEAKPL